MKTKHGFKTANHAGLSAGLLVCAALCSSASGVTEEEIHKQFTVRAGGSILVDVGVGGITVNTNGTGEVVVDVKRKVGRKSKAEEQKYLADYPVQITQEGDTITVH